MSTSQLSPLMDNTLQMQTGLMATRSRCSFALLALPIDVVLCVLEHPCMLARDLCRIEACNKMLQGLVDDRVWKGAFLTQRRCNTLREPECWKQEYARRESWSRGWRNLPISLPSSLRRPLSGQSLRRFALKCMTPAPPPPTTHIVDASGAAPGSFLTIGAALKRAKPFDSVLVSPGTYTERLTLDKSVELTGLGPLGSAVIVGTDGAAVMVRTPSKSLPPWHPPVVLMARRPSPCSPNIIHHQATSSHHFRRRLPASSAGSHASALSSAVDREPLAQHPALSTRERCSSRAAPP